MRIADEPGRNLARVDIPRTRVERGLRVLVVGVAGSDDLGRSQQRDGVVDHGLTHRRREVSECRTLGTRSVIDRG